MKKRALVLQILLLALSALLLTATAVAWITRILNGGGFGFGTGGAPFDVMTFDPAAGAWEARFGRAELDVRPIATTDGGAVTVGVTDLNLGTMDNVTVLNDGNKVYFRFAAQRDNILADAAGAALKITCGASDYKIYDKNANELSRTAAPTKTIYDNIAAIADVGFLECLVYADAAAELNDAASLKNAFANVEATTVLADGGASLAVASLPDYIYVCLQPDLASYRQIVKQLGAYMPCYMTFDVRIECYATASQETA